MDTATIKDFLNLKETPDSLVENAINEAKNFMIRKHVITQTDPPELMAVGDILSAWKYLTAYFLLPQLTMVVGDMGATKQIGMGEQAQQLISETDIERKQKFYYNHAMNIITDLLNQELPFGVDV